MGKKKGGLPKSIIKKYGITKEAWRVYRGGKTSNRKVIRVNKRKTTRRTMARRRYSKKRRRSPNYTRKFDTGMRMMARVAPYGMAHAGVAGMGYNVVEPAMSGDIAGAIKYFFVNTLLLHTGYDAEAGGWNWRPLGVNIMAQVDVIGQIKRVVNRFAKIF